MKTILVLIYTLALSVSAEAAQPIPPLFEMNFLTKSGVVTAIGQESSFTVYLEELNQDLQAPVVYVADVFRVEPSKVQGKIVLVERDKEVSFAKKVSLMADAGAIGVLVINTDESLFAMGSGGVLLPVYGLLIPHSVGMEIRDQLLSGSSVQIRIPFVVEKTM